MSELHLTIRYVAWCLTFLAAAFMLLQGFTFAFGAQHPGGEGPERPFRIPPLGAPAFPNVSVHVSALSPVQLVPLNVSVTGGGKCVRINVTYRCVDGWPR